MVFSPVLLFNTKGLRRQYKNSILNERQKERHGKAETQARKGRKTGKERQKGRQGKLQMRARKAPNADKDCYKCGQGKLQIRSRKGIRQARNGIKANKE